MDIIATVDVKYFAGIDTQKHTAPTYLKIYIHMRNLFDFFLCFFFSGRGTKWDSLKRMREV